MIRRLVRIASAFFRSALQEEFAYRGDLFGNVIRSVLNLATAIGGVAVINWLILGHCGDDCSPAWTGLSVLLSAAYMVAYAVIATMMLARGK